MSISRRSLLLGVSLIALLTAAQDVFAAAHGCVVGPQRRRTNLNLSWGEAYRQQQYINNMWNSQRPATDGATVTSFLSWDANSYPGPGQTQRFLAWLCPDVGSTTMVAKWIGRGSINLSSMTLVNAPTTVANYRGAGSTIFNGSGGTNYNGSEILNGRVTFTSTLAASVISNCTVAQGTSNPPLTSFVICRLDEEALWDAGQNIRPFFSNLIKAFNPGSLRMMDIAGINGDQTQITQWSDRPPVGGFSYNESTLLKNKTVGGGSGQITGTNTFAATSYSGMPGSWTDGELFQGYMINTSTNTSTINLGGRGAKTIVDSDLGVIGVFNGSFTPTLLTNTWYTFFYDSVLDVVISRLGFLQGGVPIESLVEICNVCGCPGWFCIPFAASDDYIRQFATYLAANHQPPFVYIEYANEVWNSSYGFVFNWVLARGLAAFPGIGNAIAAIDGFYGYRMAQIAAIMQPILGGKLQMVLASQGSQGVPGMASGSSCTIANNVLTVGGTINTFSATFAVGQPVITAGPGTALPSNCVIASLGTGTGGAGTYNLNNAPDIAVGQYILSIAPVNMSEIENERFQNNSFPQLSGNNAPIKSADVVSYAIYYGSNTMGFGDLLWSPRPGSDIAGLFAAVQNYQSMNYAAAFAWAANDIMSSTSWSGNASNGVNQNTRFGNWNALAKKYGKSKVILYEQNHEISSPSQFWGFTTAPFNNLSGFTAITNAGIVAGSTSQNVAIPAGATQIVLYNGQAQSAFFKLGNSSVVASAGNNDGTLASVGYFAINVGANTNIAIIANGTPDTNPNRRAHIFGCQATSFTNGANGSYPHDSTGGVYAFSGNSQLPSNGNGEYPLPFIAGTSLPFPLPTGTSCVIYNSDPTTTVHIKLGIDNTVTALTSDTAVAPGTGKSFTIGANTWLAAITTGATVQIIIEGGTGAIADGTVVNNTYGGPGGILDNFLFGSDGFMSSSQYKTVVSNYLGAFYSQSQSFGSSILGMCTASPWLTFPPISLSTTATTGQGLSSLTPYSNWTAHQTWNNSNSC